MGLDSIELVIEVEDHFGITIRDAEAESIRTVGDLLALISSRMAETRQAGCPSFGAFLRIRQLMRDFLRQPELHLRPSTRIASVVPVRRRRQLWRLLAELFGAAPPPLRRPASLRLFLAAISTVAIALGLTTALIDPAILPLGITVAVALATMFVIVTSPLCVEPPTTFITLGDMSQRLVGLSTATRPALSAEEVLERVRSIVSSQLGVDSDKVVPEARFVEDLGMS